MKPGGDGDWNSAWNWADVIPNSVGATARMANNIAAPSTVTTDTGVTVGQLLFDSPYGYTLAGAGSLTIDVASGSASIVVLQGTHEIRLPTMINDPTTASIASGQTLLMSKPLTVANGSMVTIAGGGTMQIASTVTASSGSSIRVNNGHLRASSDLTGLAVNVDLGDAQFDVSQHLSSLAIAAGAKATLRELERHPRGEWQVRPSLTFVYLGLGDTARALSALEESAHAGEPPVIPLADPMFDPLRRSARFAAAVQRLGLDERRFTSPTRGRHR